MDSESFSSNGLEYQMPCRLLIGFQETGTHSRARGGWHVSTLSGLGRDMGSIPFSNGLGCQMSCESLDGLSINWDPFKGTRRLPRVDPFWVGAWHILNYFFNLLILPNIYYIFIKLLIYATVEIKILHYI